MLTIRFTNSEVSSTIRLATGLRCASLIDKYRSPQQLAIGLIDTPLDVKQMLLAYYKARQAHEYSLVVQASMLD